MARCVEFQPSSWSRGSYLNVGCNWLWQVKAYFSFDEGNRVKPFTAFVDEGQFRSAADSLAEEAAREITRYRGLFPSVVSVSNYYLNHRPVGFWPIFNAAIACALSGRPDDSRGFFKEVTEPNETAEWAVAVQADARELSNLATETERFRRLMAERVLRTRELQKLPPIPAVDFGLTAKLTVG